MVLDRCGRIKLLLKVASFPAFLTQSTFWCLSPWPCLTLASVAALCSDGHGLLAIEPISYVLEALASKALALSCLMACSHSLVWGRVDKDLIEFYFLAAADKVKVFIIIKILSLPPAIELPNIVIWVQVNLTLSLVSLIVLVMPHPFVD